MQNSSVEEQFDRFADWCENREKLTEAARHTVEVLLEEVETLDCQIADERLADFTEHMGVGDKKLKTRHQGWRRVRRAKLVCQLHSWTAFI